MSRGATRSALGTLASGVRELLAVRWIRVLAVLFCLVLAARLGLTFLLARAVDRLAAQRELACDWEDLSLSLLSGRGEVRFLSLRPLTEEAAEPGTASPPLFEVEYALFDLELWPLLRGDLRVLRAEVDGLDARLERDAEGHWNLERHVDVAEVLALLEPQPEAVEDEEETDIGPQPIDLSSPVAIDALRLQHARLRVIDAAIDPPLDARFEASVRLSNLDTSDRPVLFSVTATGGELLAGAKLEALAHWSEESLRIELRARAGGFRPSLLTPYLAALDVRPACETISADLQATLEVEVIGEARDAVRARLLVENVELAVDGAEALAMDELVLEVDSLSPVRAVLPRAEITGMRGRAELRPEGALRAAGFDFLAAPPHPGPAAAEAAAPAWADAVASVIDLWAPGSWPRWASLVARHDPEAYPWTLDGLLLRDATFDLLDSTVSPPAPLAVEVARVELADIAHDPSRPPEPVRLTVELSAPGILEDVRLEGELLPFAPNRKLDLTLAVDGIGLEGVDPYLRGAGLEDSLEKGSFRMQIVGEAETDELGRTRGWIEVREAALRDSGELFGVRSIAVRDILSDPAARHVRLGDVEIDGPRLAFRRDASNAFMAFGLRTLGRASVTPESESVSPPPSTPPAAPPEPDAVAVANVAEASGPALVLELGRLAWTNSRVAFVDASTDPPGRFELEELGFELLGLTLGGDAKSPVPEPARFEARLRATDVLEELSLAGTILSRPGPLDLTAELALRGNGLRGRRLAGYLGHLGAEPALADGTASLDLGATLVEESGALRASLVVRDAKLVDGGTTILSMKELSIEDLLLGGDGIAIGEVRVVAPFARVERDPEGALLAGGLRFAAPPPVEDDEPPAAAEQGPPTSPSLPLLPDVKIGRLAVEGAALAFSDATLEPALETELRLDFTATDLATDGRTSTIDAGLSVPTMLDELHAHGFVMLGPEALVFDAELSGRGLRSGPLARYLPPGIEVESEDGRFSGELSASLFDAEAGGLGGELEARALRWGEGDASEPWLACESLRLAAVRIDPAASAVELGAVRTEGLELRVRRDIEGALHVLGLRVAAPEPMADAPMPPAAEEGATESTVVRDVRLPSLSLTEPLQLELARLVFVDENLGPDARPIEARVAFGLEGPCVIVNEDPRELPPLEWRLEGAVAGLVEEWTVEGRCTPFAEEPRFEARLVADGVRTQGLVESVPALVPFAQGEVEEGRLEGTLEASLSVRRRRPDELGLARGFGAHVLARELYYRDRPGGVVLLGVDEIQADVKRIDPRRGLVHVDTIDVRTPRARIARHADGLHALGFVLHLPPAEEVEPATDEVVTGEPEEPAAEPATERMAKGGELRIDRLLVSGIDVELLDDTGSPPLRVPLTNLDAELKRFSTRTFQEKRPFHFSAYLESGGDGPAPAPGGPVIEASAPRTAESPVFEELALAGRVTPYPAPTGWAQVQLTSLELARFAGLAAAEGLVIEDGALDASLRLRLKGERGARVSTSLVFSDLDLEEPEGGPIAQVLSLPVALDTVLFLLRNSSDEHRFGIGFDVDQDGVSVGQIALAATGAMAGVIASAVAGAPLRLLGSVVPDSDEPRKKNLDVLTLAFEPGSTELAAADHQRLEELGRRLADNSSYVVRVRHELTATDVERATLLANPSQGECRELVAGLRLRKSELTRAIEVLATEARAYYAVGAAQALEATEELRALERELVSVEDELDRVFEILRADSPRQRQKRTRASARTLAELRLEAATEPLAEARRGDAEDRVEVRSPRFDPLERPGGGAVVVEVRRR